MSCPRLASIGRSRHFKALTMAIVLSRLGLKLFKYTESASYCLPTICVNLISTQDLYLLVTDLRWIARTQVRHRSVHRTPPKMYVALGSLSIFGTQTTLFFAVHIDFLSFFDYCHPSSKVELSP